MNRLQRSNTVTGVLSREDRNRLREQQNRVPPRLDTSRRSVEGMRRPESAMQTRRSSYNIDNNRNDRIMTPDIPVGRSYRHSLETPPVIVIVLKVLS
jgi:hypothetical protein